MDIHNKSDNYGCNPIFDVMFVGYHDVKEDYVTNPNKTSLNETNDNEQNCHVISMLVEQIRWYFFFKFIISFNIIVWNSFINNCCYYQKQYRYELRNQSEKFSIVNRPRVNSNKLKNFWLSLWGVVSVLYWDSIDIWPKIKKLNKDKKWLDVFTSKLRVKKGEH